MTSWEAGNPSASFTFVVNNKPIILLLLQKALRKQAESILNGVLCCDTNQKHDNNSTATTSALIKESWVVPKLNQTAHRFVQNGFVGEIEVISIYNRLCRGNWVSLIRVTQFDAGSLTFREVERTTLQGWSISDLAWTKAQQGCLQPKPSCSEAKKGERGRVEIAKIWRNCSSELFQLKRGQVGGSSRHKPRVYGVLHWVNYSKHKQQQERMLRSLTTTYQSVQCSSLQVLGGKSSETMTAAAGRESWWRGSRREVFSSVRAVTDWDHFSSETCSHTRRNEGRRRERGSGWRRGREREPSSHVQAGDGRGWWQGWVQSFSRRRRGTHEWVSERARKRRRRSTRITLRQREGERRGGGGCMVCYGMVCISEWASK